MKKKITCFLAAAATLVTLLTSCQKGDEEEWKGPRQITVTTTFEGDMGICLFGMLVVFQDRLFAFV